MDKQIINEGLEALAYFEAIFALGENKAKEELGKDYERCLAEYLALQVLH